MTYDFNYTDNEGDEFQSNDHKSESAARSEWARIRKMYDNDCRITESWKYDSSGDYQGAWY